MYYAYVLLSLKDKKFYVGFSSNLKRRLEEHKTGGSKSTKCRLPFKLIYYEAHASEIDARRREKYFKTDKGKSSLKQMLRNSLAREKIGVIRKKILKIILNKRIKKKKRQLIN